MKLSTIVFAVLAIAAVLVFGVKLISGAISIIGGAFNAVLGIVVILALVAIVIWMFAYAKKNR